MAMVMHKTKYIFFILNILIASSIHAEIRPDKDTSKETTRDNSLSSLIEEALEHNPEILVFNASLSKAKGDVVTARTWENPELSVGPGVKRLPDSSEGPGDQFFKGNLEVTQKILFPGKRSLEIAIAKHDLKSASIALEAIRSQLSFKVQKAFYELLGNRAVVDLRENQVEASKNFLASAKKRAASGFGSDFDAIKGEAEYIASQTLLREAQAKATSSKIELNTLLGRDAIQELSLTDKIEEYKVPIPFPDLLGVALNENPSLKVQLLEAQKAGLKVDAARLSRAPDFNVGPFVEYGRDEQVYGFGVSVPLPLWDQKTGAIESSNAEKVKAFGEVEKLKLEITQAVQTTLENFNASKDELSFYSGDFLKRLKSSMNQAQKSYESGGTTFLIFLDAKRTYFDAYASYYEALSKVSSSYSELQSAVGIPLSQNRDSK